MRLWNWIKSSWSLRLWIWKQSTIPFCKNWQSLKLSQLDFNLNQLSILVIHFCHSLIFGVFYDSIQHQEPRMRLLASLHCCGSVCGCEYGRLHLASLWCNYGASMKIGWNSYSMQHAISVSLAHARSNRPILVAPRFVLTPGMDPTGQLRALAVSRNVPWQTISLGQGQEPRLSTMRKADQTAHVEHREDS